MYVTWNNLFKLWEGTIIAVLDVVAFVVIQDTLLCVVSEDQCMGINYKVAVVYEEKQVNQVQNPVELHVFSVPVSVVIVNWDGEHLRFVFYHYGTIQSASHHYFHIHNHLALILLSWFIVKKSDKVTMSTTAVSFIAQDSQNFIHEVVQDFNLQIQTVLVQGYWWNLKEQFLSCTWGYKDWKNASSNMKVLSSYQTHISHSFQYTSLT